MGTMSDLNPAAIDDSVERAAAQFDDMLNDRQLTIRGQCKAAVDWAREQPYPSDERRQEAARELVKFTELVRGFFLHAELAAVLQAIPEFRQTIRRLAQPLPTLQPAEEVQRFATRFEYFRYQPEEIDRLLLILRRGERLLGVSVREITTDGRKILRSSLRDVGASASMKGEWLDRWRAAVPNDDELRQIERDLERQRQADARPWSAE